MYCHFFTPQSRLRHLQISTLLNLFTLFVFPKDRLNPEFALLLNQRGDVVTEYFTEDPIDHRGFHLGTYTRHFPDQCILPSTFPANSLTTFIMTVHQRVGGLS